MKASCSPRLNHRTASCIAAESARNNMVKLLLVIQKSSHRFREELGGRLPPDELPAIAAALVRLHEHMAKGAAAAFAAAADAQCGPLAGDETAAAGQAALVQKEFVCLQAAGELLWSIRAAAGQQLQAELQRQQWQPHGVAQHSGAEAPWAASMQLVHHIQTWQQGHGAPASADSVWSQNLALTGAMLLLWLLLPDKQQCTDALRQAAQLRQAPEGAGASAGTGGTPEPPAPGSQGCSSQALQLVPAAGAAVLEALPDIAAGLGTLCQAAMTGADVPALAAGGRAALAPASVLLADPSTLFSWLLKDLGE